MTESGQLNGAVNRYVHRIRYQPAIAWLLWICGGIFGFHRFYIGQVGRPMLMAVTLGGVGVWWIIDAFLLPGMIRKANAELGMYAQAAQNAPHGIIYGGGGGL